MDIGLAGQSAKVPRAGLHAIGQPAEIMHPAFMELAEQFTRRDEID